MDADRSGRQEATGRPRTLAEWLRGRDDAWLARLIERRPDVAFPPPADTATLASRLAVRISVSRALDLLTAWEIQVLDALLIGPAPGSIDSLLPTLPGASTDQVEAAVEALGDLALVWGDADALQVSSAVREAASRFVGGLGRPATELFIAYSNDDIRHVMRHLGLPYASQPTATGLVAERLRRSTTVEELLARAPEGSGEALGRLTSGIPHGELRDADRLIDADDDTAPVRWLLSHGLLAHVGPSHVELPREVGLALRGDEPLGPLAASPPEADVPVIAQPDADGAGATHLQDVVRHADTLLRAIADDPPRVLRTGGVGVRDVKRIARTTDLPLPQVHLLLHLTQAAGLLATTSAYEPEWLPTPSYDDWRVAPVEQRWAQLVEAWWTMSALAWLCDEPGGDGPRALSDGTHRAGASGMRERVLTAASDLGLGAVANTDAVHDLARWRWPRRMAAASVTAAIEHTLAEAETLGLTGRGAVTTAGRALLAGADLAAAAAEALPAPIDHILLQADLTAIAPGRLDEALALEMDLIADVESAGGATVYRISDQSLRRAMDAGRGADDIRRFVTERSRTPAPQALDYLIDDVARRHGAMRVGSAAAYLRCDDPLQLDLVQSRTDLAHLRLRRLAPTVLICEADPGDLLDELRSIGMMPSVEGPQGVLIASPEPAPRSRPRLDRPVRSNRLTQEDLDRIVSAMRVADLAEDASADLRAGSRPSTTMAVLQEAAVAHSQVSLDYVDENASLSTRLVTPSRVIGGFLYAYDHASRSAQRFAIHRVVTATPAFDPSDR